MASRMTIATQSAAPARTQLLRNGLLDELSDLPFGGMILIEAPGGFGKTVLATQIRDLFVSQGGHAIYLKLDTLDRHPARLARRLIARIEGEGLTLPELPMPSDTDEDGWRHVFAPQLAEGLEHCSSRLLVILDDYHLCETRVSNGLLQVLSENLPGNMMLAVISRRGVGFPVSRPLMDGRLIRFDKRSLAFTKEETRVYFDHLLPISEVQHIHTLSQGWPAAIVIAQASLRDRHNLNRDIGTMPEFVRLIADYCRIELLSGLEEQEKDFLIDTAILDILDAELCDRLRGADDSPSILSTLASRHLLIEPVSVDPATWRLAPLLRQESIRRLSERGSKRVAVAYERAAEWHDQAGHLPEAVRYYVRAGRPDAAISALEHVNLIHLAVVYGDEHADELLGLLPNGGGTESPGVALCRAYLNFKRGMLEEAQLLFEDVRSRTESFSILPVHCHRRHLEMNALVLEAIFAVYRRSAVSLDYIRSIEERLPGGSRVDDHLLTFIHITLGLLYELRGDLDSASDHLIQADQLMSIAPSRWQSLWSFHNHGTIALSRGQHMEARYLFQAGLKRWRKEFRAYRPFRDLVNLLLAEIDYERASFAEAQAKVDEALYTAENIEGWLQHHASAYETQMMLLLHTAGRQQSEAFIAKTRARRRFSCGLHRFLEVLRVRLFLLIGETDKAEIIVRRNQLNEDWATSDCHDKFSWREWDLLGLCLAQLTIEKQEFAKAAQLAEKIEQEARHSGRARTLVRALILRSRVEFEVDRKADAITSIVAALEISHAQRFWQSVLDEGRIASPVLELAAGTGEPRVPPHIAAFAGRLLRAIEPKNAAVSDHRPLLSDREMDVVRELTLGHSNKMIARKLTLSEATVKFHLANIFRKLRVRRRSSVAAEAQRRGWAD